jgi:Flp pilus assembly protein TadG
LIQKRRRQPGQALVELAIVLPVFLIILMGIVDLGRGIYMYNGASNAAREIARVTSVHPGSTLGSSVETAAVIATQKRLIPNLGNPTFVCVDISGTVITTPCQHGQSVQVKVIAAYQPITPILGLIGHWDMQSTSTVEIQ